MPEASNPFARLSPAELRRRGSLKWTHFDPDVLPLWVAEMDTQLALPVREALERALRAGATGYPSDRGYPEAFATYAEAHWSWGIDPDRARTVADAVTGLSEALRLLTAPGDPVVITPPVWPVLRMLIEHAERMPVPAQLTAAGRLDLGTLEEAFDRCTWRGGRAALLLCSPHNPTGTVHSRAELAGVAELAERYRVRVVVDEMFAPVVYRASTFVPYLSVPGAESALAITSASKAWNLGGLKAALIVPGAMAEEDLARLPELVEHGASAFGMLAHATALREGGAWLSEHLVGLEENRDLLGRLVRERLPAVDLLPSEGTYLAWLDFADAGLPDEPAEALLSRGRVAVVAGAFFGAGGDDHVRLNFATAPAVLAEAVERMASVVGPVSSST